MSHIIRTLQQTPNLRREVSVRPRAPIEAKRVEHLRSILIAAQRESLVILHNSLAPALCDRARYGLKLIQTRELTQRLSRLRHEAHRIVADSEHLTHILRGITLIQARRVRTLLKSGPIAEPISEVNQARGVFTGWHIDQTFNQRRPNITNLRDRSDRRHAHSLTEITDITAHFLRRCPSILTQDRLHAWIVDNIRSRREDICRNRLIVEILLRAQSRHRLRRRLNVLLISIVRRGTTRVVVQITNQIITAPARRQRITFRLTRTGERNAALNPRRFRSDVDLLFELLLRILLRLSERSAVGLAQLRVPLLEIIFKLRILRRSLFGREDILNLLSNRVQRNVCRIRSTRTKPSGVANSHARGVIVINDRREIIIADLIIGRTKIRWRSRASVVVELLG